MIQASSKKGEKILNKENYSKSFSVVLTTAADFSYKKKMNIVSFHENIVFTLLFLQDQAEVKSPDEYHSYKMLPWESDEVACLFHHTE